MKERKSVPLQILSLIRKFTSSQARLNIIYFGGDLLDSPYPFSPYLIMDGDFGSLTTAAVKDFQSANGLSVGNSTWAALNLC